MQLDWKTEPNRAFPKRKAGISEDSPEAEYVQDAEQPGTPQRS